MVQQNNAQQITLEPYYYYHLAFPIKLKDLDSSIFNDGVHLGQYASYKEIENGLFLAVRDPLGIGKLFYTESVKGEIHFSDKFVNLFKHKSEIFSVPAGTMVLIGTDGRREMIRSLGTTRLTDESLNIDDLERKNNQIVKNFRTRVENRLHTLFEKFGELEKEGWSFFIALSGGLDSTIIASKASKYLHSPIACTLDLGKSEDSEKSLKIAAELGLKHIVFSTNEEEILQTLDDAPILCQDYRDFNVHCATLNILLAKNINQIVESDANINKNKVIVLTGDLMNEFTCDYAGEVIDGVEYYRLPRVNKKDLQEILINGLDTSDREISVFEKYGLKCIQPYAILYDLYQSIPESILNMENSKKVLNSFLVDAKILQHIPKTKLRAQVGSRENMGILGLCHKKGIDNKTFYKSLLDKAGFSEGNIPIFAGHYEMEEFI